jgi:hypothetical protein
MMTFDEKMNELARAFEMLSLEDEDDWETEDEWDEEEELSDWSEWEDEEDYD